MQNETIESEVLLRLIVRQLSHTMGRWNEYKLIKLFGALRFVFIGFCCKRSMSRAKKAAAAGFLQHAARA
jgi:hypothetical protein